MADGGSDSGSSMDFEQVPDKSAMLTRDGRSRGKREVRVVSPPDGGTGARGGIGASAASLATTNQSLAFEEVDDDAERSPVKAGVSHATFATTAQSLQFESQADFGQSQAVGGGLGATDASLHFETQHTLASHVAPAARKAGSPPAASQAVPHAYRAARESARDRSGSSQGSEHGEEQSLVFQTQADTLHFRTMADTQLQNQTQGSLHFDSVEDKSGPGRPLPSAALQSQSDEASASPPASSAGGPRTVKAQNRDGHSSIRFFGSIGAPACGYIPNGEELPLLREERDWVHVQWKGQNGVVKRHNTSLESDSQGSSPALARSGRATASSSMRTPEPARAPGAAGSSPGSGRSPAQARTDGGQSARGGRTSQGATPVSARKSAHSDPAARTARPSAGPKPPVERRGFAQPRQIDKERVAMRETEQELRKRKSNAPWRPVGGEEGRGLMT
eukprot:TRINITY_DN24025_c0_g1_i1.p1 TRINITY_DN24025_c0_g1~~TRINITY_DN24025_c0_g1_i1.p1  ORF type:complete len:448 (+),score=108.01 TRINITY_DN24025_c0_g1_i1:107-1450(+)